MLRWPLASLEIDVAPDVITPERPRCVARLDFPSRSREPVSGYLIRAHARRFPKVAVSARTIDAFVRGSNAVPAAGAGVIAAAVADAAANPTSTVLIEGFTDDRGNAAANRSQAGQRANAVGAALQATGVGQLRMHTEGRGAVNFVAGERNGCGPGEESAGRDHRVTTAAVSGEVERSVDDTRADAALVIDATLRDAGAPAPKPGITYIVSLMRYEVLTVVSRGGDAADGAPPRSSRR